MTSFIDPVTLLPHRLGEIYSDRHIMIAGSARWTPGANPTDIGTLDVDPNTGLKLITTPIDGGSTAITTIAGGTSLALAWDTVTQRGSSVWVDINRLSGSQTVTLGNGLYVYAPNAVPKPTESRVLVLYRASTTDIIATASFIVAQGPLYTKLGVGTGQRVFAAIVGDDVDSTHNDLQSAINVVASGSWILVKKMCNVAATINTNSKVLKLMFVGQGTGLQASGASTGISFDQPGCQLVGFGEIKNFTGYGVDLNNKTNCRVEMVFSNNSNNINFGTLNYSQVNIEGSYGLSENSQIAASTTHGSVGRWNNTTKRWEPTTLTIDDNSKFSGGQNVYAAIVGDTPAIDTHSDLQTAINAVPANSMILVRKTVTTSIPITTAGKALSLVFSGNGSGITYATPTSPYTISLGTQTTTGSSAVAGSPGAWNVTVTPALTPAALKLVTGSNVVLSGAVDTAGYFKATGTVARTLATATGFPAATTFTGTFTINGTARAFSALGSAMTTWQGVLTALQTQLGAYSTVTWDATGNGSFVVTSLTTGATSTVVYTPGANNIFGSFWNVASTSGSVASAFNGSQIVTGTTGTTFSFTSTSTAMPWIGSGATVMAYAPTVVVTATHSLAINDTVAITNAPVTQVNGSFTVTATTASSFSYQLDSYNVSTGGTLQWKRSSGTGTVGLQFGANNCRMVGFGKITGFDTGIDLNSKTGCRIEAVFSGNTTNVNFGTVTSDQVNLEGSYGLTENSHIEIATSDGQVARWSSAKKRWEPVTGITISSTGAIVTTSSMSMANATVTGTLTAGIVIGAVYN
jgi:hypothetical protein